MQAEVHSVEDSMESLRIIKSVSGKTLNDGVKSLIVLDSSFNPPHSAHLALIRAALKTKFEAPASVILMYASKNADKDTKDEENAHRLELMKAFSKNVSELCETHICLTKHPYFVDKFEALKKQIPHARQIYIVGYDTFVRILDKKYYADENLAKSGLGNFFNQGKLLCALREDEKLGDYKAQSDHIARLSNGAVEGVPSEWGKNIEVLKLTSDEGLGVSSTNVREAIAKNDHVVLHKCLTPEVREVIRANNLYSSNDIKFPYLTREHVLNCSFSKWHAIFKHISPRARVIKPLPLSFIQYLNEDGLMLPQDSKAISKIVQLDSDSESTSSDGSSFEDEGFSEEDPTDSFRELHERIETEMAALGGAVVPKLNWSSPKDALWITADKTLKCTSPSDIYMLLKSSDFIVHDLEEAFESCDDNPAPMAITEFELVLKKWFNAQPSMEFRCFVNDSRLMAISQRDVNYYEFLSDQTKDIVALAVRMFNEELRPKFSETNFVFDMYASVDQGKAWLLDINPYSPNTDPLLFTWTELLGQQGLTPVSPEIRLVSKDSIMSNGPQYSAHQVPYDLIDSSDGVDPATFAHEFQQRLAKATFDGASV